MRAAVSSVTWTWTGSQSRRFRAAVLSMPSRRSYVRSCSLSASSNSSKCAAESCGRHSRFMYANRVRRSALSRWNSSSDSARTSNVVVVWCDKGRGSVREDGVDGGVTAVTDEASSNQVMKENAMPPDISNNGPSETTQVPQPRNRQWELAQTAVPVVCLHLLIGTLAWMNLEPAWQVSDAFYFAVTTFLTIGYGDLSPSNEMSRAFSILYIFMSLVLQLTVVGTFISRALSIPSVSQPGDSMLLRIRPRIKQLALSLVVLMGVTSGGAAILHFGEQYEWLDSFYWASVTLTTVGYGDITPTKYKVMFAVYFLLGVLTFTYLLGDAIALVLEVVRVRRLREFLKNGFTEEMLRDMDVFADGQITQLEFMMFMLKRMELAEDEQLNGILQMFDELDISGDGVLDTDDMRRQIRQSIQEKAS